MPLIIASLAIGVVLCLPVVFANAEDTNQANTNENKNVNEARDSVNANRENVNININESEDRVTAVEANINEQEDSNENKGNVNENKTNTNENRGNGNQLKGDEHRSAVATFVQSLLDAANKDNSGIGEEVKAVAKAQNDTKEQESEAIDKINARSKVKTFFLGTDYKNTGMLRSQTVKTQNQIDQLNALLAKTTSADTKIALQAQISALTLEQQKINDFIKANESKFSLFGWFVKLFNK